MPPPPLLLVLIMDDCLWYSYSAPPSSNLSKATLLTSHTMQAPSSLVRLDTNLNSTCFRDGSSYRSYKYLFWALLYVHVEFAIGLQLTFCCQSLFSDYQGVDGSPCPACLSLNVHFDMSQNLIRSALPQRRYFGESFNTRYPCVCVDNAILCSDNEQLCQPLRTTLVF